MVTESDPGDGDHANRSDLDPRIRAEIITFLRGWLPPEAKRAYREMILHSPEDWYRDPHFIAGGLVDRIFKGNGITPAAMGITSLDDVWWELLAQAVAE